MLKVDCRMWATDGEEVLYDDRPAELEVQRTDLDEIRVGVVLVGNEGDDLTVYLTVEQASRLAHMLSTAVLANEAAAHEGASFGD